MEKILDFKSSVVLPSDFIDINPKRMIYACGDGMGGPDKDVLDETNVEAYSKLGYNIFCCVDEYSADIQKNKEYLINNLNAVLCILTGDNSIDYPILERLFQNSIDLIKTDDRRFFPPSHLTYKILKIDGDCTVPNLRINGSTGYVVRDGKAVAAGNKIPPDLGWKYPNFLEKGRIQNNIVYTKREVRDEDKAESNKLLEDQNTLLLEFDYTLNIPEIQRKLNGARRNSWVNWRKKHPLGGSSTKKNKKNKKRRHKHKTSCKPKY